VSLFKRHLRVVPEEGHRHRADRKHPVTTAYPADFTPRHRLPVIEHPSSPACHHDRFMRMSRNTTVPACPNPRVDGSLYCEHHQRIEQTF